MRYLRYEGWLLLLSLGLFTVSCDPTGDKDKKDETLEGQVPVSGEPDLGEANSAVDQISCRGVFASSYTGQGVSTDTVADEVAFSVKKQGRYQTAIGQESDLAHSFIACLDGAMIRTIESSLGNAVVTGPSTGTSESSSGQESTMTIAGSCVDDELTNDIILSRNTDIQFIINPSGRVVFTGYGDWWTDLPKADPQYQTGSLSLAGECTPNAEISDSNANLLGFITETRDFDPPHLDPAKAALGDQSTSSDNFSSSDGGWCSGSCAQCCVDYVTTVSAMF